jgi:hypothetical protein
VTNKNKETTASVSVHEFARICKQVDREFEDELVGVFAQKRTGNPREERSGDKVEDDGITFCLCCVPGKSPIRPTMTNMVMMAGRRWGAENAMATAKGPIGWDESQFRKWGSMQHHTALAGLAMLKASIIRERLSELSAASGAAGGKAPEARMNRRK